MRLNQRLYRGFACPQEGLDEPFAHQIAVVYAREYARRFLGRFGEELERKGRGLTGLIAAWLGQDQNSENGDFEAVWDPAFGELPQEVLSAGGLRVLQRAAALGLRLHECGWHKDFELQLPPGTRLRWGPWLLPEAEWIGVSRAGGRFLVEMRCNGAAAKARFWKSGTAWKAEGAAPLPQIAAQGRHFKIMLPPALGTMAPELRAIAADEFPTNAAEALRKACSILRQHASPYWSWCSRVVRWILPTHAVDSAIRSAHSKEQPGVVQMSICTAPAAVGEMLVHEGSHFYFHIVDRLGPLHDGSDQNLYYSPVRRMGRPIYFILMAYHAFANVLLYYRLCQTSGLRDGGYCRKQEEDLRPQLEQLESALKKTSALTPAGKALWRSLSQRIA